MTMLLLIVFSVYFSLKENKEIVVFSKMLQQAWPDVNWEKLIQHSFMRKLSFIILCLNVLSYVTSE